MTMMHFKFIVCFFVLFEQICSEDFIFIACLVLHCWLICWMRIIFPLSVQSLAHANLICMRKLSQAPNFTREKD